MPIAYKRRRKSKKFEGTSQKIKEAKCL